MLHRNFHHADGCIRNGPNEQAIERHATTLMRRILEAAGGTGTMLLSRTAHTIGICRMGTDRETAVVNADGKSFDIDNLWICGNSVFPSALFAKIGPTGLFRESLAVL